MGIDELLKAKREEILRLAANYGARNVRIFGSRVRDGAGPRSDVDFLVDMEEGRSLLDLIALWQDLEDLLCCEVDIITDGSVSPYLRDRVYSEAVPL